MGMTREQKILNEIKRRLTTKAETAERLNQEDPDTVYRIIGSEARDNLLMIEELEKIIDSPLPF